MYTIIAYIFAQNFVKWMGGQGEALLLGTQYFKIISICSLFWIYGLAGNMIVRAEGKMKSAAVMMGAGLIINIIANYILVVIMKMGVTGAAWGTNIGMLIYTISSFIYFSVGKATFDAKPFKIEKDKKIIKGIISNGMPSLIMVVMTLFQGMVVFNALSKYGTTYDLALYGVIYRIFMFLLTPVFGLMRALQPVIGINYGAEKNDRVISSFKIFAVAATVMMFPFWLFSMIDPKMVLGLMFVDKNIDLQSLLYFRIYMMILPLLPVIFMMMTFYPAINKGKPAAIIGIIRQVVFFFPVMLILPRVFGIRWVYYGSLIIDLVIVCMVMIFIKIEFDILRKNQLKN